MKDNWIKVRKSQGNRKTILRAIKVLIFFLFAMTFKATAALLSQEVKIDINMKNARIKDVFMEMEKSSDYVFLFSGNIKNELDQRVNINLSNQSLDDAMKSVVRNTGLMYKILDKQVVVYRDTPDGVRSTNPLSNLRPQQDKSPEKVRITGTVTDQNGEPLVGVNIVMTETSTGVITNQDGQFIITVPKGTILRFTYIGFVKQEIKITGEKLILNIKLVPDSKEIDEVVVTGYGNVRKESFTGSVTQIKTEDLMKVSTGNLINTIQAFDPSFRLMDNIEFGSNPNVLPEFYIRGQSGLPGVKELDILESSDVSQFSLKTNPNTPIFIIDGFEVSVEKVYDLDITRIKSMTLHKDAASTAIYGSRAANGVIVIETVEPQSGKFRINYTGSFAYTTPDLSSYNLMNTKEKIQAETDSGFFGDPEPHEYRYSTYEDVKRQKMFNFIGKNNQLLRGVDTYWLSKPLTSTFNHKHTLFLEGGVDAFRFGIEARFDRDNGVMKKSFREKKGVGLVMHYVHKRLQIKNNISFNHMSNQNSPYGNFSDYVSLQPYYEPIDVETGEPVSKYTNLWGASRTIKNPLYEAVLGNFNKGGYTELINNLSINLRITDNLLLKGQYAVTYNDANASVFTDPESSIYLLLTGLLEKGELKTSSTKKLSHNINLFGSYSQSFKEHYLNTSLGLNVIAKTYDYMNSHYRGFANKSFNSPAFANEIVSKPLYSDNKTHLFGFFLTSNYTYRNIYLFDASIRIDGSSEFGAKRKWAPFWSLGTGLNLHHYPIFKKYSSITQFRVTGNIGETGKSNFAPYMANNMFVIPNDEWYPTGIGAELTYMGNENLSWEKTFLMNIALDLTIRNQYNFQINYYRKTTNNLISDVSLPSSSGFTTYKDNVGQILNQGVEAKINLNIIKGKEFNINLFGNIAHNKNRINEISESLKRYNERIDEYYKKFSVQNDPYFYLNYHYCPIKI